MTIHVQTITMTTGAAAGPETFRFNPQTTLFSFTTSVPNTTARLQMSLDNGATWEPGFLFSTNLTNIAGSIVSLAQNFHPPLLAQAPLLFRINGSTASAYTCRVITIA